MPRRLPAFATSLAIATSLAVSACGVETAPPDGPWRAPDQDFSAVALSAGHAHVCAESADGSRTCWGDNRAGQLIGAHEPATSSVVRTGGRGTELVVAGRDSVCLAGSDGAVRCDGANRDDTLPPGAPVTSMAIVRGGVCAAREDGTVQCAGSAPWLARFLPGADQTDARALAVAGAEDRACLLRRDGTIACWGRGWAGDAYVYDFARDVDGGIDAAAVAVGAEHACLRSNEGRVRCWGDNAFGQLGSDVATSSARAIDVPLSRAATAIAVGPHRSCAIVDGGAFCWGRNGNGLLGDGSTDDRSAPAPVGAVSDVTSLALGGTMSCATVASGHAVCWGSDTRGELGRGEPLSQREPVRIATLPRAASVAVGADHLCVAAQDGDVWCVGRNDEGQLGDGTTNDAPSAIRAAVPTLTDEVRAWGTTTCAYEADGSATCFGADEPAPEPSVGILPGGELVAAERAHACDLTGGVVRCWGSDHFGAAYGGTDAVAATVPLPEDAIDLDVGPDTSCAAVASGDVWCWGRVAFATGRARRGPEAVVGLP